MVWLQCSKHILSAGWIRPNAIFFSLLLPSALTVQSDDSLGKLTSGIHYTQQPQSIVAGLAL